MYRDIPDELTVPCEPTRRPVGPVTYADVFVLWARERAALETCNGQLDGIRSLGNDDNEE